MKKLFLMILFTTLSMQAERIYATFDIQPHKEAHLAFNAGGTVDHIATDVAMLVKRGGVLATLDHDDLIAKLSIAKIAMEHAKTDYERQLSIKEVVQRSKLDLYKFQYDNAKAEIDHIQTLLDKTLLKAPFDGIISAKMIEVGDVVSGMAPRTAFVLQSEHERKLILQFDQKYWKKVQTGNAFEYTVDGDDEIHHGVITKIYPRSNAKNRKMTAEVYAHDLIVGLFGTGYIITQDEEGK